MNTFRNGITRILNGLAGISFLAMVLLTCWQVLTRYVLQNPSTWSEELVGYLFAWMSLLGASLVTCERGHMNIPIIVERFSEPIQKLLNCLGEVIAFLFSAIILVFGGAQITTLAMGQMTSSLGVPIGIFYIVLPLCGVLNMIYTVLNIINIIQGRTEEKEAV
ncbi:MAG: TRAP transporter small permease [Ruminococcus sp.]|jgi:TRAP-type C4-dicarboxylate transport system permease small subunit|nr:TRAP transporter small permease [uncultured Schaedlerella sp.]MCI9329556.1 TRAP transporter small permease [Ruminococcus sp.]